MNSYLDFLFLLLSQFAGGPGPKENNLVRFGLAAVLWGVLWLIAWNRQRQKELPREKWLVWGFGLAFIRELFMFAHVSMHLLTGQEHGTDSFVAEPLEHALSMAAVVVIAGAFLRYILDDPVVSRRYLQIGLGTTAICFIITLWWWPQQLAVNPGIRFHNTWEAWLYHLTTSILILTAMVIMLRKQGWVRNVVLIALAFFFLGEFLFLFNYITDKIYGYALCPIANTFHILAIPIFGFVYIRELFIERQQAEEALKEYQNQLEDLVEQRTTELTQTNQQLQAEIAERVRTEQKLEQLSRQNELILHSAGEGIFGVDLDGNHTFVNSAAARMLGYSADELINKPSHATWHHSYPDGTPYPEESCLLHNSYKTGKACRGDDQVFWRKDGSSLPVRYVSTPINEQGELTGTVVVFQDITERKQAQEKIARRNTNLAALNAIAATISQSLDLDTILNIALDTVRTVLGMEIGGIFLLKPETETLTLQVYRSRVSASKFIETIREFGEDVDISQQAVQEIKPVVRNLVVQTIDSSTSPQVRENLQTLVSIPLVSKDKALGALTLGARQPDAIQPHELELLAAIGQQIGVAVENAQLHKQVEYVAALEERQRIAAEMHDGLAQTLSYLGHKVDQASETIAAPNDQGLVDEFDHIRHTINQASYEVRRSIASLQQTPQPSRPFQELLAEIVSDFAGNGGPAVDLVITLHEPLFLPQAHIEQVTRVVQESLLNANNHAQAKHITLSLARQANELVIEIEDDGRGFDPEQPVPDGRDHFGLKIMRARAARIEGVVTIDSQQGCGTRVIFKWPAGDP